MSATTGSLAALLAAGDEDLETHFIPPLNRGRDAATDDWGPIGAVEPVMPADYVFEPQAPVQTRLDAPAPAPAPKPVPSVRNGGGGLLNHIAHLASGGALSREETIETLLALIEDGQSSDPVVFGPTAAHWYAQLHAARQAGSTVTD